jgi:hypothetical protein
MSETETGPGPSEGSTGGEAPPESKESREHNGCAPGFIILILMVVLLLFFLWPEKTTTESPLSAPLTAPTATLRPGAPSPVRPTETPIPPPGTPSFDCQPGIKVGKTIDVVYPAVRMRHSPGYVEKDDRIDTKHYLQTSDKVVVKGGPEIKDGLCWWLIEHEGLQGWTADHSREGRLLLSAGQ